MDIDKVLNNNRLVRAVLGVTKKEFLALLPTFTQIVKEEAESKKRTKRQIRTPEAKDFFVSPPSPASKKP